MQAGSQLETVVRAEIQARIEAVKRARDDAAADGVVLRSQVSRAEQKMDLVLESQRALNGKHNALRGEHDTLAAEACTGLASARADAATALARAKDAIEGKVLALRESLEGRAKELESMYQVR